MNIVLGEEYASGLSDRYIVLTLDTFHLTATNDYIKSFCLVENMSIDELSQLDQWRELHENLIRNYNRQNWFFCEQAIEHLLGKWNGELDSFYKDLTERIDCHKINAPGSDWTPFIDR